MFEDFLKQYLQDYLECSVDKYYITESEKEKIVHSINNNDNLWSFLDEIISFEIEQYKVENGGEENND